MKITELEKKAYEMCRLVLCGLLLREPTEHEIAVEIGWTEYYTRMVRRTMAF